MYSTNLRMVDANRNMSMKCRYEINWEHRVIIHYISYLLLQRPFGTCTHNMRMHAHMCTHTNKHMVVLEDIKQ